MSEITPVLVDLFVIFVAPKVAAEVFDRLRRPAGTRQLPSQLRS
jgi:hypothetical protein